MMIVGITGTNGAGKGTMAQILVEKGFKHYSVREYLTKALSETSSEINRESMLELGNNLRKKYGPAYIAEELYKTAEAGKTNSIIESIRNPEEAKSLKKHKEFVLFAVEASKKVRFKRIVARGSNTDRITYSQFLAQENKEIDSKDKNKPNISKCIKMADYKIQNNGTVDELRRKVNKVIEKLEMAQNRPYERPSWDDYFMEIVNAIAKRATCDRGRSGSVIAKDKQVLTTGYVGSPVGFPHCDEVGHQYKKMVHEDGSISQHCVRTVHAEQNAICQAAKRGVSIEGATLYAKMTPCRTCAMLIINSGIVRVYCERKYHAGVESEEMFRKARIELVFKTTELMQYSNQ